MSTPDSSTAKAEAPEPEVVKKPEGLNQSEAEPAKGKDTASASQSPKKADTDKAVATALQHLAAGKRSLLVGDLADAVSLLADASQMLSKVYGETNKECGEVYYHYGKALLELGRVEAGVIDNVMDGVPDTEDDVENSIVENPNKLKEDEIKDIEVKVAEAIEESTATCDAAIKKKAEAKKDENKSEAMDVDSAGNDKDKKLTPEKAPADPLAVTPVKIPADPFAVTPVKDEQPDVPDNKGPTPVKDEKVYSSAEKEESSKNSEEEGAKAIEGEESKAAGDEAKPTEGESSCDDETAENESIGSNEEGTSHAKESDDKNAIEAEDEEDPSNLQLAWEMLELAKKCLHELTDSLNDDSPKRLDYEDMLSDAYQALGEVSVENESYEQAIEDFMSCLRRRQELLPADSRRIAETHYQMGVAYGFGTKFDEAIDSLNEAIAVLELRVTNLKNKTESKDRLKALDAFYTREKEIEEIEGLLPEIREKIKDTQEMAQDSIKRIGDKLLQGEELETSMNSGSNSGAKGAPSGGKSSNGVGKPSGSSEASDISHMVKKRKKPEEASSADNGSSETKKPHLESADGDTSQRSET